MVRKQFPIKLSLSFTVHKGQGQTLQKVGIYLNNEMFGHGMSYVSASRVTEPSGLRINKPKTALLPPPKEPKKTNDLRDGS